MGDVELSVEDVERREVLEHEREILDVSKPPVPPKPVRSKAGEFAIVRVRVENAGDEGLESISVALVVGGKPYHRDLDNEFYVEEEGLPFPIEPGDSEEYALLFDLPLEAAGHLESDGSLVLVASEVGLWTPLNSPVAGRIRLAPG
jgi:hypothetical protein